MVNKKSQRLSFVVDSPAAEKRLDQWLAMADSGLSRTVIRKVIDLGGVHVNGRRVRKCSLAVNPGDQIELYRDQQPLTPFRLSEEDILYRDKFLLVVNKPSGVESQPTPARYKGTLYEALMLFLKDPYRPLDKPELGMVQRLDRDTSGAMIFSIHSRSHKALTESWQSRRVQKVYHALVRDPGLDNQGEFISLLARNRRTNRMKSVERGGKSAHTRYRVLKRFSGFALVEIELLTGRMHQIRVHFSEAGAPLLGDKLYGGTCCLVGQEISRTMLHSFRLVCDHPVDSKVVEFEAPRPHDFDALLTWLEKKHDDLS
ncbi:RluA family pseudouridine synthase [uncultured Desulfuromonas sp.]|uniref:RluA family pseudouridine synthase n=1 Tax=uncultured Desulfuromonas sp. TaxID=181013 RepID=UPI002AAB4A59|nr:RluA family pseudouridine synthase [uncultured Desulfuromonas sp.]